MGFAGYFLIVADFIALRAAQRHPGRPGPRLRGGQPRAWSLGITGVDPIEYDIIFERFLNPERICMPDIDVDFCMKRARPGDPLRRARSTTTRATRAGASRRSSRSGRSRRAPRCATSAACSGMPFGDVDRIAKLIPETLGITLDEALEQSPELRARIDADGQVRKLFETARKLEGLTRHASTHAAGVVIGTDPLIETVPLYRDSKSGDVVTQYDMRCVEKIGLIKFDFLGLRTLTTIAAAARARARARRRLRHRHDPATTTRRPTRCSAPATPRACSRWSRAA